MKTIQEKNEMIATFMGSDAPRETWVYSDEAEYHESWDWIMPVVQKIKSIGDKIMDNYELLDELDNALIHAEMKHVYKSVVNIIKYLNKKN